MTLPKKHDGPDLIGMLRQEVERHPYRTVAIAAGIRYLLGTRPALGDEHVTAVRSRIAHAHRLSGRLVMRIPEWTL